MLVLGPVLEFWMRKCWSGGFKVPELLPALPEVLAASITIQFDPGVIQRGKLHPIQSDLWSREWKLHLSNLERVTPRWVLVHWGRSKYHDSSNVFICQRWCTLIGCLGAESGSKAIASSASYHSPLFWEGELHLSNLERVAMRWVLVHWGQSKYHDSSNVFICQCWCTLIGHLGAKSCPTAIASSASDHFPLLWEGELHLSNLESEFWSTEDIQNIMIHPMYSSANVDVLSLDVWGTNHVL